MYQSIDDEMTDEVDSGRDRPWILWIIGVAIIGGLFLAGMLNAGQSLRADMQVDPLGPEPEARRAYLKAIAEPHAPLRRARLTDFLNQHSQNPRAGAVRAQLEVLDAEADQDWLDTLTTAYDPRVEFSERRRAVEDYRREWGRYLGARDDEIDALMAEIDTLEEQSGPPDRTLKRNPDTYAGIPDDRLEGGPYGSTDYRRRARDRYRPSRPERRTRSGDWDVIAPRISRNVTPRYPRRALRRGVEAVVVLSLDIDERGRVFDIDVVEAEADRYRNDFVEEARRAARRTRFEPQTVGGVPVEALGVRKRYRFQLTE